MRAGSMAGVLGGLATAAVVMVGASVAPAWAASDAPPGNNGTIKVDGLAFDQGHDNEPHPGCTFRLTFFGFDAGSNTAAVTFDEQAPTGSSQLLQDTVTFTASRDHGGATFDGATPAYDLSSALASATASKQGYHVKVSVSVNGGNAKHKVFWIDSCSTSSSPSAMANAAAPAPGQPTAPATTAAPSVPATPTSAASEATGPSGVPQSSMALDTTSAMTSGPALVAAGAVAPAAVLGETVTRSPLAIDAMSQSQSPSRGADLAFTGFDAVLWSMLGLASLAFGTLLVRRTRVRHRRVAAG